MKKTLILCFLMILIVLLTACTDNTSLPSEESTNKKEQTDVDPFKEVRKSKESWLYYGLSAHNSEKEIQNLKEFFSDPNNITYLTLYDHMFSYDKEKSVPVAEALFEFIYDNYGADALLDVEKRLEYKTAYLNSLGLDMQYWQTQEVETFFVNMDFDANGYYRYICRFDNATYYFKDFTAGAPGQYHGFLYMNTKGLWDMIEYIKTKGLSEYLNTDREFNFYMTLDSGYSSTKPDGTMIIGSSYSALHEAVHAMGIKPNGNIWLSEGICGYLGKFLRFNDQISASYIQILTMVKNGYYDERAVTGDKSAILKKALYEEYTNNGGKLDDVNSFDLRTYYDSAARVELEFESYDTIGQAYEDVNKEPCTAIGAELSYDQSTSLMAYLVDTYGIETVFEAYKTQEIETCFGKDYDDLKAEWLTYLV